MAWSNRSRFRKYRPVVLGSLLAGTLGLLGGPAISQSTSGDDLLPPPPNQEPTAEIAVPATQEDGASSSDDEIEMAQGSADSDDETVDEEMADEEMADEDVEDESAAEDMSAEEATTEDVTAEGESEPEEEDVQEFVRDLPSSDSTAAQLRQEFEDTLPDRNLVSPDINLPEDPQDIETPDAPPLLNIPENAPPVEIPDAGETLELPQDPLQVRVESIQGYSLVDALDLAVERNPDILDARLNLEIATTGIAVARSEYYPQLSTQVNYAFVDPAQPDPTEVIVPATPFSPAVTGPGSNINNSINGEIRFSWTVIDGGGRIARNLIADQELAIARLILDQTIQAIRLNVAEAYYNLQLADTNVLVAEASVDDSLSSLRDAEARERAGIGTRFEVLQAEARLANDQQELLTTLNNQRVARFQLASLVSFDPTVALAATDPIEAVDEWELSLEETLVEAFESRAEFEQFREEVERERQLAQNELSAIRPRIDIFTTFDYQALLDDNTLNNSFIDRGYSVGAVFNWTFFDGGRAVALAQQADLRRQQARLDFVRSRDDIRLEVEDAFFSLNTFRAQIDAAKIGLESANESLRLARLRFEAGVGTQTDVLNAQSELTDARQNLANAISNYNVSVVQLRRAVNAL